MQDFLFTLLSDLTFNFSVDLVSSEKIERESYNKVLRCLSDF
jgi:hypothetical protein